MMKIMGSKRPYHRKLEENIVFYHTKSFLSGMSLLDGASHGTDDQSETEKLIGCGKICATAHSMNHWLTKLASTFVLALIEEK